MRISDWSSDVCSSDLRDRIDEGLQRNDADLHGLGLQFAGHRDQPAAVVPTNGRRRLQTIQAHQRKAAGQGLEFRGRRFYRSLQRRTSEALDGSEEHTSELQSLMRISYAVFCLKKK